MLVSKTRLKQESHEIQKLGKRLTGLSSEQLDRIPLDEPVREAIALAHKIQNKRSALKRHYQFIGKLLRARDTGSIFAALEQCGQSSHSQIQRHHRAEYWRDQIVDRGIDAIEELLLEQSIRKSPKFTPALANLQRCKQTEARKTRFAG